MRRPYLASALGVLALMLGVAVSTTRRGSMTCMYSPSPVPSGAPPLARAGLSTDSISLASVAAFFVAVVVLCLLGARRAGMARRAAAAAPGAFVARREGGASNVYAVLAFVIVGGVAVVAMFLPYKGFRIIDVLLWFGGAGVVFALGFRAKAMCREAATIAANAIATLTKGTRRSQWRLASRARAALRVYRWRPRSMSGSRCSLGATRIPPFPGPGAPQYASNSEPHRARGWKSSRPAPSACGWVGAPSRGIRASTADFSSILRTPSTQRGCSQPTYSVSSCHLSPRPPCASTGGKWSSTSRCCRVLSGGPTSHRRGRSSTTASSAPVSPTWSSGRCRVSNVAADRGAALGPAGPARFGRAASTPTGRAPINRRSGLFSTGAQRQRGVVPVLLVAVVSAARQSTYRRYLP